MKPAKSAAPRYPLFDYLRILLAVGVFAAHADRSALVPEMMGNACVQIFFALSGFLIGGILLESTAADLPRFFFNRVTRVWVPYFVAITVTVVCSLFAMSVADPKFWELVFYQVTFTYNQFGLPQAAQAYRAPMHGVGHVFWSVCVEEQFYLLAPFVLVFLSRRAWIALLLGAVALNFVHPHNFAAISLGVLLAASVRRWGHWFERPLAKLVLGALVLALAALMWLDWPYQALAPWLAVCTIALVAYRGQALPGGAVLGGMSYPFYLNHWIGLAPRLQLQHALGLSQSASTSLALAIALGVSLIHYQAIDRVVLARRPAWFTEARGRRALAGGLTLAAVGFIGGAILFVTRL